MKRSLSELDHAGCGVAGRGTVRLDRPSSVEGQLFLIGF